MFPVRVMLVDDSPVVLRSIQSLLKRLPELSVMATASDGAEALPIILVIQPELLIIDNNMPKMNGLELLDELRKMNSPLQVIVFSVYHEDILKQYALEKGAATYVPKDNVPPFLDTIQRIVNSHAST